MATTKVSSISFGQKTISTREHSWETLPASISSKTHTCVRTRTGSRLAKWREIISDGGNATTGLSARWDTFDSTPVVKDCTIVLHSTLDGSTARHIVSGSVGCVNTDHGFTTPVPGLPTTETDNIARAKFYGKLYQARTAFQGSTFLGELSETLHMLKRPAAALWDKNYGYLSALRKAKRRDPKNWLKTAGGLWLEQAFGWKPLINDCKDAYQAYQRLVGENKDETVPISAGAVNLYDRTKTMPDPFSAPGYPFAVNFAQNWYVKGSRLLEQHKVRYKGAIRRKARATQWDNLELFGFNAESFIPTAWELLPWSFLIDYFTNIGDILQASVTRTSDVTYVNKTTIATAFFSGRVAHSRTKPPGLTASWWVIDHADESEYGWSTTSKSVVREANSGIPMPTLQLSFDLTDGQLGNIAALLSQFNGLHRQGLRYRPT